MSWVIYNSAGVPLISSKNHDHTVADGSGPATNDEHDGYSEYDEIVAPGAGAANKLRVYAKDVGGVTALAFVDSAGVETTFVARTRRVPMSVVANPSSSVALGADFNFPDSVSSVGRFAIPIPSDWVPGTDITLNLLVFKLAAGNAVVVLESSIMSGEAGDDFSASAWNVENAAACGRTLTDDIMSQVTRTVPAASIATTKNLHWSLKRLGADVADTVNAAVFSYYGPWIEYTAFF